MRLDWGVGTGRTRGGFGARTKNWTRDEVGTGSSEERQGRVRVQAGSESQLDVGCGVPGGTRRTCQMARISMPSDGGSSLAQSSLLA